MAGEGSTPEDERSYGLSSAGGWVAADDDGVVREARNWTTCSGMQVITAVRLRDLSPAAARLLENGSGLLENAPEIPGEAARMRVS
jgi:hypothetical protein